LVEREEHLHTENYLAGTEEDEGVISTLLREIHIDENRGVSQSKKIFKQPDEKTHKRRPSANVPYKTHCSNANFSKMRSTRVS